MNIRFQTSIPVFDRLVTYYLRLPDHPFKLRIARWLLWCFFPKDGLLARVHPNLILRLNLGDCIEAMLLLGIPYEPITLDFLERNLQSGDTACLSGVNFGQHVAVAARAVGNQGCVIGIEPQPRALLKAAENLQLNQLDTQVKLVQTAISDEQQGLIPMAWSSESNRGAVSLTDQGSGFVTTTTTLSECFRKLELKPRLLLLDIQGFEEYALNGLDEANVPEIIVVEIDHDFLQRARSDANKVYARLIQLGYQLFDLHGKRMTECETLPQDARTISLIEFNVIGVQPNCRIVW